jgi:hypothetical protein
MSIGLGAVLWTLQFYKFSDTYNHKASLYSVIEILYFAIFFFIGAASFSCPVAGASPVNIYVIETSEYGFGNTRNFVAIPSWHSQGKKYFVKSNIHSIDFEYYIFQVVNLFPFFIGIHSES